MRPQRNNVTINMESQVIIKAALWLIFIIYEVSGKTCDTGSLVNSQCSQSQVCDAKTNLCECKPGYDRINDTHCGTSQEHRSASQSSLVGSPGHGSIIAGVLIPLALILIVIIGVYIARRYELYSWVRKKINQRYGNYDEFMIGQDLEDDDPPLR